MKWYKVTTYGAGRIEAFEVVKETDHFVTYKKHRLNLNGPTTFTETREAKVGVYHAWYATFDAARGKLIELCNERIQEATKQLQKATEDLDNNLALCE